MSVGYEGSLSPALDVVAWFYSMMHCWRAVGFVLSKSTVVLRLNLLNETKAKQANKKRKKPNRRTNGRTREGLGWIKGERGKKTKNGRIYGGIRAK